MSTSRHALRRSAARTAEFTIATFVILSIGLIYQIRVSEIPVNIVIAVGWGVGMFALAAASISLMYVNDDMKNEHPVN
jgi:hypothetical protein